MPLLASIVRQARGREPVRPILTDDVRAALASSGRDLLAAADAGDVYGLTTGVGALRGVAVEAEGQALRLWRSHAATFGPGLTDDEARATMLVRLHQIAAGPSGVSLGLAEALERALVEGSVPLLRAYGSIGTGDLGVLAQLGLALVADQSAQPLASDALPFLSSNAMTVALGILAHQDLVGLLAATDRIATLSLLALRGSPQPFDRRTFLGRDATAAERIADLVAGAELTGDRVQDPFALRTVPQVHGVALSALDDLGASLLAEVEGSGENPLPVDGGALHHGGFLTQRLAAAGDAVRQALLGVATLSQARLAALVDPRLTGLPAFLAHGPAGSSGLMILEYVAADVAVRAHVAAAMPATLARTTVSLGLEEFASHSTQSLVAAGQLADLLPDLLACELLAATRALRLAPERMAGPSRSADLGAAALAALGDATLDDHVLGPELDLARALILTWADDA